MSQSTISPELALKIQADEQSAGHEPDAAASQAQAGNYDGQLETVHDLRIVLFDNDTGLLFAATYEWRFPAVCSRCHCRCGLRRSGSILRRIR
jgi:hypothetical protein